MLYLEDYLEFIENLPQEFRERLTSMRELDLQVNNEQDRMNKKITEFFASCPSLPHETRCTIYEELYKDYSKLLEIGEEKITMTNQLHELIVKYHKKLEQELHKFKIELEADNAGITQQLERRALMMENASTVNPVREKRKVPTFNHDPVNKSSVVPTEKSSHQGSSKNFPLLSFGPSPASFNFDRSGFTVTPNSALGVASVQAIAATQQQMQQGRRTASMKANYDLINATYGNNLFNFEDNFDTPAARDFIKNFQYLDDNERSLKKARANKRNRASTSMNIDLSNNNSNTNSSDAGTSYLPDDANDEPRYCICNGVSYGDMIYCENKSCPYQWFHYKCVDIEVVPEGSWFCPTCAKDKNKKQ